MHIDDVSFNDISIFHAEEKFSIFHKLNFTRTEGGKFWLKQFFTTPLMMYKNKGYSGYYQKLLPEAEEWPEEISNGTMMVMNKFLDYALDTIGDNPSSVDAFFIEYFIM